MGRWKFVRYNRESVINVNIHVVKLLFDTVKVELNLGSLKFAHYYLERVITIIFKTEFESNDNLSMQFYFIIK